MGWLLGSHGRRHAIVKSVFSTHSARIPQTCPDGTLLMANNIIYNAQNYAIWAVSCGSAPYGTPGYLALIENTVLTGAWSTVYPNAVEQTFAYLNHPNGGYFVRGNVLAWASQSEQKHCAFGANFGAPCSDLDAVTVCGDATWCTTRLVHYDWLGGDPNSPSLTDIQFTCFDTKTKHSCSQNRTNAANCVCERADSFRLEPGGYLLEQSAVGLVETAATWQQSETPGSETPDAIALNASVLTQAGAFPRDAVDARLVENIGSVGAPASDGQARGNVMSGVNGRLGATLEIKTGSPDADADGECTLRGTLTNTSCNTRRTEGTPFAPCRGHGWTEADVLQRHTGFENGIYTCTRVSCRSPETLSDTVSCAQNAGAVPSDGTYCQGGLRPGAQCTDDGDCPNLQGGTCFVEGTLAVVNNLYAKCTNGLCAGGPNNGAKCSSELVCKGFYTCKDSKCSGGPYVTKACSQDSHCLAEELVTTACEVDGNRDAWRCAGTTLTSTLGSAIECVAEKCIYSGSESGVPCPNGNVDLCAMEHIAPDISDFDLPWTPASGAYCQEFWTGPRQHWPEGLSCTAYNGESALDVENDSGAGSDVHYPAFGWPQDKSRWMSTTDPAAVAVSSVVSLPACARGTKSYPLLPPADPAGNSDGDAYVDQEEWLHALDQAVRGNSLSCPSYAGSLGLIPGQPIQDESWTGWKIEAGPPILASDGPDPALANYFSLPDGRRGTKLYRDVDISHLKEYVDSGRLYGQLSALRRVKNGGCVTGLPILRIQFLSGSMKLGDPDTSVRQPVTTSFTEATTGRIIPQGSTVARISLETSTMKGKAQCSDQWADFDAVRFEIRYAD